jgi:predicted aminopeptidase
MALAKDSPSFRTRDSAPGRDAPRRRALRSPLRIILGWAAACVSALFPSCYVADAAAGYAKLLAKARPVGEVLADPASSESTKAFLKSCADIRAFAIEELGLKESKNYTTYANPGRDYIADVVQACAPLSFQRYLWDYPFVGKLPYQGFFERPGADKEAARLRAAGYDVIVRPVDAFSTLGYLKDPLWSFMASYTEVDLADLLIHELTHATVFKRGRDDFNEGLASFVGERGAILYLESRHGKGDARISAALARRQASRSFRAFLAQTASLLEALYASQANDADKKAAKARIISERAEAWKAARPVLDPGGQYAGFDMAGINNAYLDLFRLYYESEDAYALACDRLYGGHLRAFVAGMAALAKTEKDPAAALARAAGDSAGSALP